MTDTPELLSGGAEVSSNGLDVQDGPTESARPPQAAIGIVADHSHQDATLRAVVRAKTNGWPAFVAVDEEPSRFSRLIEEAGGKPVATPNGESETVRTALAAVAKQFAVRGLAIHTDVSALVDYSQTGEAIAQAEDFVVDSVTVTQNRTRGATVAGIPAYNEADTIAETVRKAGAQVDEVVVVDDGSTDDTAIRARDAGATVIRHAENSGYGAALTTLFRSADERDVEQLVILDGDGQHDPNDIPRLLEELDDRGPKIVIGSRFADESETEIPLYRRIGIGVVNVLTNLSLGVVRPRSWTSDTQSGFRAYNRGAIKSLAAADDIGEGMNASTDILYHGHHHDFDFQEIGASIRYDVDDRSTHNPVRHGLVLVSNILRTVERDRPVTVLGVPGFLSALLGIGFGYWTFSSYIATGVFPIGLALTSATFGLAGIFACFTAIILHSLNTHLPDQ